ncbi:Stp1/IreP family PP2C-type Ser/Thr phosphatase [Myxococcota bacterium]|nr:Stp1/IreP family PP2C-type Ser/Thr phosphatase [Myxococcota bacterium]
MRLYSWALTDVGNVREQNEDNHCVNDDLGLFLVADGMGGHAGGQIASRLAAETVEKSLLERTNGATPEQALHEALRAANSTIFEHGKSVPELAGMGTTCTAILRDGSRFHLAHVGDSRAYLFRDGQMTQLTADHTWVSEQLRAGYISAEEAAVSRWKSVITRSVGFGEEINIDMQVVPFSAGDVFLLCSDGLSNYFKQDELERLFTHNFYANMPQILIETALARGGADNCTLVLCYAANE